MTDSRVEALSERVLADLVDHLHDLQQYGGQYIRDYVEVILGPKTTRRPPYKFHPKLAELIRELAIEAAMMDRRPHLSSPDPFKACGAAPPLPTTRDGRVSVESSRRKAAA